MDSKIARDCLNCLRLQQENDHLKKLLTAQNVSWEVEKSTPESTPVIEKTVHIYSTEEKIALFRRLFCGRTDVYPVRWESKKGGAGYSPACENEWRPGICGKPHIKCGVCKQRKFLPVTDRVIYNHLAGQHTIGVYPLLKDDRCYFLATDFDESSWQDDALAFMQSCKELEVPAALEISRSGRGAHTWIFFSEDVSATEARKLGAALISYTCSRTRQLSLDSYDRFFPNQDTLPRGGFGNLIALPLQKGPREKGHSLFVSEDFTPHPDQWAFLATQVRLSATDLNSAISRATAGEHPLDISFLSEEEASKPWQRISGTQQRLEGPLPKELKCVLADQIYIEKTDLPQPLTNRLIRLAAFQNPEFYKAQAMRMPVWNKPRVIGCAENFPQHIGLPRGCLEELRHLLAELNIDCDLWDERTDGNSVKIRFTGQLRSDQKRALTAILKHDTGVLCAPTAFGKTVIAADLLARRKVNTLILVHRTELLRQWQERLQVFLDLSRAELGVLGGGKKKLSGQIDIAVMQSLLRREDLPELLDQYGQIIVDECHHLSAVSFEGILKQVKARYVIGLTATPFRRDGHDPIIFMQCGPIRHRANSAETAPSNLKVFPKALQAPAMPVDAKIQDVFHLLAVDELRNQQITKDVLAAYTDGRKILVLTERTEHLSFLHDALNTKAENCFVLHGRLSKKQRAMIISELESLDDDAPRILLATGRLVGEGFDHPPLDTLVLAMPVSWKGTLQQYAGRLHRDHVDKSDVRIYDYFEHDHPQLARMWKKRLKGYKAMGYTIGSDVKY